MTIEFSNEKAWMVVHQKGSKQMRSNLDEAQVHNPVYHEFVKKHGFEKNLLEIQKKMEKEQQDAILQNYAINQKTWEPRPETEIYIGKPCKKCLNTVRYAKNKSCVHCNKRYSAKSSKKRRYKTRDEMLYRKYGITQIEYDKMLISQNYACAICKCSVEAFKIKGTGPSVFHVDHDHATGSVRGLLCPDCNKGLGLFKDKRQSLKAAVMYLEQYSKNKYIRNDE